MQNKLLSVLAKNGFYPVALAGDLKQAFLQVRIREEDRDVMRFHWLKDLKTKQVEPLRFTRALFGLSTSPFLLGGVIDQHLRNLQQNFPNEVEEVKRSLYVDDLITCVTTVVEKEAAQANFREGRFQLHKWHSNVPSLKEPPSSEKAAEEHSTTQQEASHSFATPVEETAGQQPTTMLNTSQTFAKYYVGVKTGETKLLDVPWNKRVDTIEVAFPAPIVKVTKREILKKIAKIYDPSGLDLPVTLAGKILYRETFDAQVPWDCDLPRELKNAWENWERMLTGKVEVPRSLVEYREEILSIDLRAFGDASSNSAAVYAVTQQSSGITRGLVTS